MKQINDQASYSAAIVHVVRQAEKLADKIVGRQLPIDTLAIFAQSSVEYEYVDNYLRQIGTISKLSHGATLYVEPKNKMLVNNHVIKHLGARQPDSVRPERGYVDFPVDNYAELKIMLAKDTRVKEVTSGTGMKLLELKDPSFDVRGYIVESSDDR